MEVFEKFKIIKTLYLVHFYYIVLSFSYISHLNSGELISQLLSIRLDNVLRNKVRAPFQERAGELQNKNRDKDLEYKLQVDLCSSHGTSIRR
mgnify:FL=1